MARWGFPQRSGNPHDFRHSERTAMVVHWLDAATNLAALVYEAALIGNVA
jgi:hypothetical protein